MLSSPPFHALVYWPHVAFGIASAAFAIVAIFSRKGSFLHRNSGQFFAVAMTVAALSAIAFSLVRFAPNALISAFSVLYAIAAGILALRSRNGRWRRVEKALSAIPLALTLLGVLFLVVLPLTSPEPVPPIFYLATLALIGVFGYFFWSDVRYFRRDRNDAFDRLRRHAARMALAAAETARAPLISFGPPLFGEVTGAVYFFGPFLLIPLIYKLAMPEWARKREMRGLERMRERRFRQAAISPVGPEPTAF